jgi:hypothetical protein
MIIASLKSDFLEKESQYQAKITSMEQELMNTKMSLSDVKAEKDHYYNQLSKLD